MTARTPRPEGKPRRERRWPPALALLVLITLPVLLPDRFRLGPTWMLPAAGGLLLVAVVIADPDQAGRRSGVLRTFTIALTIFLIVGAAWFTATLAHELIYGGPVTQSAVALLSTSAVVWVNNNIIFGFLYWELDSGGPAARARHTPPYPDFAFPQHMNPDIAPPRWRAVFVDYFYLGLTNATAFSPTDTLPLAPWAKLSMALQSMISMIFLGLVVSRAVNVLA